MKRYLFLPLLLALTAVPARAQQFIPDNRILATALGAGTGMAGGSFMSVSIVVLESRYGRYIHDIDDVIGWRSLPAVSGVVIGGGMGALSPRRLEAALIYGTAGIFAGGLVGAGVGKLLWDGPEAKWAGASIGVGVGLGVGTIAGIIWPVAERDGDGEPVAAGIPIAFRVTF